MTDERIDGLEKYLEKIAEEIEDKRQSLAALEALHARYSVALHLIKQGIEPKEIKPL